MNQGPVKSILQKKFEVVTGPWPTIAQRLNPINPINPINPVICPSVSRYVNMVADVIAWPIRELKCVAYLPTGVNPPSKRCGNGLTKNRDASADLCRDL